MRFLIRFIFYILIAWLLSPILEVIFPVPTKNMVDSFVNLSEKKGQDILFMLRLLSWSLLLYLIFRFTRPLFEFIAPTSRRYSVTKPMRRVQGIITEVGLILLIFITLSVIPTFYVFLNLPELHFNHEVEKSIKNLAEKRSETRNNLIYEAGRLNDYVLGKEFYWSRATPDKEYIASDTLLIPIPDEDGPYTSKSVPYFFPSLKDGSIKSASERIAMLKAQENDVKVYWLFRKFREREDYKNYFRSLRKAYKEYETAIKESQEFLGFPYDDDDPSSIKYFIGNHERGPEFTLTYENSASSKKFEYDSEKFRVVLFPYLQIVGAVAFILYFLTHLSIRIRLASHFEKVLRFFEQGRFGLGGASRFAGVVEEWATQFKKQEFGIFLGKSLFNPRTIIGSEDKRHMLTVAATRAGKGTTAIIPNLLLWKGSAIVVDPKGTNAIVTARRRRELEQNVQIIDPFSITNEESASFNPLQDLNPNSPTIREDIYLIAEALVIPDPNQKERHWDNGARTVIAGLIAQLISDPKYKNPNLSHIRDLLALGPKDQEDLWLDMMLNEGVGGLARDAGSRILRGSSTNEINSILSNADKHTEWLSSPTMKKLLSSSSLDFSQIRKEPTTVYLVVPPNKLETYNRFIRLFLNLSLAAVSTGERSKLPILMIMDEFLALGRMEEVEKALGLLAGYNLILWPIIQEFGKLKDIYKDSFNAFIDNSRAIQVFGVTGESAKFVSEHLGDRRTKNLVDNNGMERVAKLRSPYEVTIDVNVENNWQYVLRAGKAPLAIERVAYYQHKMFEGLYDPDPDYA